MKTIRGLALCLIVMLFMPLLLHAQDLSKYRGFFFGMSPAAVLKQTDMKMADVKTLHSQPALIQELTWWLPMLPGNSYQADSVREILFTFCNGQLYRMSATYDRSAIEGLTAEDLMQSIAAKYGPPIDPVTEIDLSTGQRFTLIMYSLQTNAAADEAIAKAIKLEEQQGPQKEADRQKKEADELALARLKNLQSFRP